MFHKNRKLAALEPRHLLPVWLLEMYWERPRNLFFHYARCCCCRCQRCLRLVGLAAAAATLRLWLWLRLWLRWQRRLLRQFGIACWQRTCVCACMSVVRVKRVCDEVENMLHVQPNELRSRLRQQRQRICRRAALLLLLLLYCNVMRNCCASFN